jgi:hypothetical protein
MFVHSAKGGEVRRAQSATARSRLLEALYELAWSERFIAAEGHLRVEPLVIQKQRLTTRDLRGQPDHEGSDVLHRSGVQVDRRPESASQPSISPPSSRTRKKRASCAAGSSLLPTSASGQRDRIISASSSAVSFHAVVSDGETMKSDIFDTLRIAQADGAPRRGACSPRQILDGERTRHVTDHRAKAGSTRARSRCSGTTLRRLGRQAPRRGRPAPARRRPLRGVPRSKL